MRICTGNDPRWGPCVLPLDPPEAAADVASNDDDSDAADIFTHNWAAKNGNMAEENAYFEELDHELLGILGGECLDVDELLDDDLEELFADEAAENADEEAENDPDADIPDAPPLPPPPTLPPTFARELNRLGLEERVGYGDRIFLIGQEAPIGRLQILHGASMSLKAICLCGHARGTASASAAGSKLSECRLLLPATKIFGPAIAPVSCGCKAVPPWTHRDTRKQKKRCEPALVGS